MNSISKCLIGVGLVLGAQAYAQQGGSTVGNGGDTIGIEATSVANSIVGALQLSADFRKIFPELSPDETKRAVSETKFRSVDGKLSDSSGVEKDAVNFAAPEKLILIQKDAWKKLDSLQKRRLVFHEVLCLMGLESSDQYPISARLNPEVIENSNSSLHGYCEYKKSDRVCQVAVYFNTMTLEVKGKWVCWKGSRFEQLDWAETVDPSYARIQQVQLTQYVSTIGLVYENSDIHFQIPAPMFTGITMPNVAHVRHNELTREGFKEYWLEMKGKCTVLY